MYVYCNSQVYYVTNNLHKQNQQFVVKWRLLYRIENNKMHATMNKDTTIQYSQFYNYVSKLMANRGHLRLFSFSTNEKIRA